MGQDMKRIMVTGGAGFIGSAVCRHLVQVENWSVLNIDNLTYAGVEASLRDIDNDERYRFEKADICDVERIAALFSAFRPDYVIHLAAESHVDRSIDRPAAFMETNIMGTYTMLECAREYWMSLPEEDSNCKLQTLNRSSFRFLHVSTDEVYGTLGMEGAFSETSAYDPHSPYAASKAASDHLVRAWHHTYGLPVLITNCSNNYGPFQFPEKLIPQIVLNALEGRGIPVYGKGEHVRDWLYVEDHVKALCRVIRRGRSGETYSVGGGKELTNLELVQMVCRILDELRPRIEGSYSKLIDFVEDRPGHDLRYAIDASKLEKELGWSPEVSFEHGIRNTVRWYLENDWWWRPLRASRYAGERLGRG